MKRLYGQLQRIHQQQSESGSLNTEASSLLMAINEDIHWLLLIAG